VGATACRGDASAEGAGGSAVAAMAASRLDRARAYFWETLALCSAVASAWTFSIC